MAKTGAIAKLTAMAKERQYAGGGIAKLAKRLKGTQETLPAAEREANKAKFLAESKTPMRLYHGTTASEGGKGTESIRRFKPSKEGALGSGVYLTPDPKFAGSYAEQVGSSMLPVYAQLKNPLILRGSGVPDKYKDPMIEALELLGMDSAKAARMVERAYEGKGYIGKEVQTRAQAQGYDGLIEYDRDGKLAEVVSYNPNAVKSAIGNKGTYDTRSPELNKAKGGEVHMKKGGEPIDPRFRTAGGDPLDQFVPPRYRSAGRRPESQQDREAAANIPVAVARGLVSGTLGLPGDIESLARLPYELITGNESKTFLPTSEDIEKRLPFRGASQTPVGQLFTGAGQLAGGAYTGPLSGARAALAVPRAIRRAGQDFVQSAGQTVSPLTVYHGSPHKFAPTPKNRLGEFDASKIGTGEGAQAYGHGLYLAEAPGVAEDYAKTLASPRNRVMENRGVYIEPSPAGDGKWRLAKTSEVGKQTGRTRDATQGITDWRFPNVAAALRYAKKNGLIAKDQRPILTEIAEEGKYRPVRSASEMEDPLYNQLIASDPGYRYTVDLPDEKIARMLDWDKPLSQQPEVIKALKGTDYEVGMSQREAEKVADMRLRQEADEWADMTGGDPVDYSNNVDWEKYVDQVRKESGSIDSEITGKDLHRMIMRDEGYRPELFDPENYQIGTSEALRGYGIPGIRYLDASSRDAGKGTSNFVVFPGEEDALTILERKKEGGEVKMAEGGAAFGRYTTGRKYQKAVKQAKEADVNKLPDPRTYAAVMGLLGSAPDQLGFSVMHPDYKGIQKAGERGFVGGTVLGVAPAVAPLTRGLPVGAAIKPVGGNWLTGSVERALDPLKTRTIAGETPAQRIPRHEALLSDPSLNKDQIDRVLYQLGETKKEAAIDQWIDRNLTNYVKKQMATPDDPVRKLAEEGVVHIPSEQVGINRYRAPDVRDRLGTEQLGKSEAAQAWEDAADTAIAGQTAGKRKELAREGVYSHLYEPWMDKLDSKERVWAPMEGKLSEGMGFDHIIDVLKQDLDAGRIRPEQLNKVSMEQAVRRTYEFDQEVAKKMREAQIKATEGMPVYREYPEGYRWVELTQPKELPAGMKETVDKRYLRNEAGELVEDPRYKALKDALRYEGDTMGHCVGGYCPDVLAGRKRVYSLRDAKGEPHVTVEVRPGRQWNERSGIFYDNPELEPSWAQFSKQVAEESRAKGVDRPKNYILQYPEWLKKNDPETFSKYQSIFETEPESIFQIKGKGNRAPNEQYLPFVQDFVRSGNWSGVGDIRNTGLRPTSDAFNETEQAFLRSKGVELKPYINPEETARYQELFKRSSDASPEAGMKAGGAVGCGCNDEPKMAGGGTINTLRALLRAPAKSKGEIEEVARRIAPQVTGEFVRGPKGTASVAEKTQKQFAREKDLPVEFTDVKKAPPKKIISPQELKGKVVTGIPGDPTVTGKSLVRVGEIKLELPSPQHGGPLYGMGRNDDIFWASGIGPAGGVQRVAKEASQAYDAPVIGQYIMMGPDSINYAQHFADANLQAIDLSKMSKKQIEGFNKMIRFGDDKSGPRPGFPGIEDKVDSYLHFSMDPHLRRHFNKLMQMPTVTERFNLPSGQDIRYAITEAPLRNVETGVTGYSMGELAPDVPKSMLPLSTHPTYSHDIPGRFIGGLKYPTPYELTFPDTLMSVRANPKQAGQEFGSLKMVGPRQIYDQQMIDELMMFEEAMKKYTGKKKGGKVGPLSAVEKV
jgi:hypothetical protein